MGERQEREKSLEKGGNEMRPRMRSNDYKYNLFSMLD